MIVTVTPNPSLDRTLEVALLVRGEVLRARSRRVEPGGKGINVARALSAHGHAVRAVVPSGGAEGNQLVGLLEADSITPVVIRLRLPVRANISIVEPDGTVTKVNEPGPSLSADEVCELLDVTAAEAASARWVVASGSLPPDAPDTLFADLTRRARQAGARVAIDTAGSALMAAVAAGADLVKPNVDELSEATGVAIRTLGDVIEASQLLRDAGAGAVLASMAADGALLVDSRGAAHARQVVASPRSSVGAGDATLAGYLVAEEDGRATALRTAVAFGAAAVSLPGSQMPGPSDVRPELVDVTEQPDPDMPLTTGVELDAPAVT